MDNRSAALKGGDSGADIQGAESAHSRLIHYVAGLVEEMEMPPAREGRAADKRTDWAPAGVD